MHKIGYLGLSLLLIAAGCSGPNSSNADNTSVASNTNPSPSSAGNATPSNSPVGNNAPSPTSSDSNGDNPSRIHQLKDLKKITIHTHGGDLHLWVMDDESKQQEGMMFLVDREVKDNEGMIFVFNEVQKGDKNHSFWMHNTILPLDIDYIAKDKKVLNIGNGIPFNENQVMPGGDYLYVIEVKRGQSQRFGLVPGEKVDIPSDLVGKS